MGCYQSAEETRVSPEDINMEKQSDEQEGIIKDRSCTDIIFLVLLGIFVIVLVGLLAYCMTYGNIYRLINGYDDCGNICGRENAHHEKLGCSGADRTNEKFLLVNAAPSSNNERLIYRSCVETCDNRVGYQRFINRCLPIRQENGESKKSYFSKSGLRDFFQEVSEDLQLCWKEILGLCVLSFVISILMIFAFKFFASFIVWLVLIGVVIALIIGTICLWILYSEEPKHIEENSFAEEKKSTYLAAAIISTIATICICLIIFALRKRIGLVIALFKEAGKAVTQMPLLMFEPLLTFLTLTFFVTMWLYFALVIESSGHLQIEDNQSMKFEKNSTILVTRWYNLFALFWFTNFIVGCQHMVVAGAVAAWFFTRNKANLSSPISRSFHNLLRYHLGTVALGSFLIAVVNLIRAILKSITFALENPENRVFKCLHGACTCCLYIFENFLQYLSRNAYIETALNGDPFCTAGKKAFNILSSNALRVLAINSVGDFVLLLAKAFVVLTTVLVGIELIQKKEGVMHSWVILSLLGLFAYLVAHCFISIYEMTIDTIFICFCEDCDRNDGINRPYFMSRGLMEFVQNSKKALNINDGKSGKAWSVQKSSNGR